MVAGTVGEICPEVFGLNGANREVFGDFEIKASAGTHSERTNPTFFFPPRSCEAVRLAQ
jgi:hypothetical protein